jgi:predicted Zn finger-like uncharacterized protein
MIVVCDCSAKLKIDDAKVGDKGTKIRCPRCGTVHTVRREQSAAAVATPPPVQSAPPQSQPQPGSQPAPSGAVVLIAHENESVRSMVGGVLADAGYAVETAADGVEALQKAIERRPRIAIIDVGLPGIYVFELCERLRENPQTGGLKIILLASVYDVSRYKRTPVSFYGADDYIEKHEVSESLVRKIHALLSPEETPADEAPAAAPAAAPQRPAVRKTTAEDADLSGLFREVMGTAPAVAASGQPGEIRSWPGDSLPPAQDGTVMAPESFSLDSSVFEQRGTAASAVLEKDPEAVEKARRLARIIVSDIALYNQEAVTEGIRSGTFFDLLREDVEEGRRLYEQRIPASIRAARDYYQDAFDVFIEAQKKNLR